MRRGQIYSCDLGPPLGHEAGFRRPALIVSPELINRFGTPIVLPITRTPRGYATHVELDGVLDAVSYIQCELIRAVASDRLLRYVAAAPPDTLARVDSILRRILVL